MRRKCWFSLLLVPPPLEKICWFLKVHKKRKYLPLFLRLSFEINFDFLHDRRVFVIKFTHATLYTRDSQISSSSVSAKENRCALSLSLSLSLSLFFFFRASRSRKSVVLSRGDDARIIYIWIKRRLFYNGFDFTCVVGQSSPQFCETTCRARASLLFTLLFSRDLIWSSIRSSIDWSIVVFTIIIVVVVKNWERAVVGVCVWNLNLTDESSSWGKFRKKDTKAKKKRTPRRFYFKILWLLRGRRNEDGLKSIHTSILIIIVITRKREKKKRDWPNPLSSSFTMVLLIRRTDIKQTKTDSCVKSN